MNTPIAHLILQRHDIESLIKLQNQNSNIGQPNNFILLTLNAIPVQTSITANQEQEPMIADQKQEISQLDFPDLTDLLNLGEKDHMKNIDLADLNEINLDLLSTNNYQPESNISNNVTINNYNQLENLEINNRAIRTTTTTTMYPTSSQEIITEFINMKDIHQPTSPMTYSQDFGFSMETCSPYSSDLGDMEDDSFTNYNLVQDNNCGNNYVGKMLIRDVLLPQGHQIQVPPKNQYDNNSFDIDDLDHNWGYEESIEINNNVVYNNNNDNNIEHMSNNLNVDEMINIPIKKKEIVKPPKLILPTDINANLIENHQSIQTPEIIEMILDHKSYVPKVEPTIATAELYYGEEYNHPSPDQQLPSTSRAVSRAPSTEPFVHSEIKIESDFDFEDSGSEYVPSDSGPASVASIASVGSSTATETKRGRGRPAKPIKRLEPASQLKLSPRQRDQYNRERNNEASRKSRRDRRIAELKLENDRQQLENRNLKLTRIVQRLEDKKARFTLQMLNLAKR